MRPQIRFALAAAVAALIGLQPAFAQQPEVELKKAQEQLEKLLKELKERESKKAETPKPPAPPSIPAPPSVPAPSATTKPMVAWAQLHPGTGDANAALKTLTASKDPKVAALAKELLEHLNKTAPQPNKAGELHLEFGKPAAGGGNFEFKVAPPAANKTTGQYEFKVVPYPGGEGAKAEPKTVERRVVVVGEGDAPKAGTTERRVVVVEGHPGDGPKTVTARVVEAKPADVVRSTTAIPAGGASTLKLSADGKTAALLSADGTITIFDVATGKETMKFSGKK